MKKESKENVEFLVPLICGIVCFYSLVTAQSVEQLVGSVFAIFAIVVIYCVVIVESACRKQRGEMR